MTEVHLGENKGGVQYFIITANLPLFEINTPPESHGIAIEQTKERIVCKTRYSELEKLSSSLGSICVAFPGKAIVSNTSSNVKKTEERRKQLAQWLHVAIRTDQFKVVSFLRQRVDMYGQQVDPSPPPSSPSSPPPRVATPPPPDPPPPFTFTIADHPAEIYIQCLDYMHGLRVFNYQKRKFPKAGVGIMIEYSKIAGVYGERCIVKHYKALYSLFYIPWALSLPLPLSDARDSTSPPASPPTSPVSAKKLVKDADEVPAFAYHNGSLWTVEGENLKNFNIRLGTETNQTLPRVNIDNKQVKNVKTVMVFAENNLHVICTSGFHLMYHLNEGKWYELKPMAATGENGLVAIAVARDFIFVSQGKVTQKYNINNNEWQTIPRDPNYSDPIATMVWDKKDYLYAWMTSGQGLRYDLNSNEWEHHDYLTLDHKVVFAFATTELGEDNNTDKDFENTLLSKYILKDVGPWQKLHSFNEISEEATYTLTTYENLSVEERVQYFQANKDTLKAVFESAFNTREGSSRIKALILQLSINGEDIGVEFPEIADQQFLRFQMNGETIYLPNKTGYYQPFNACNSKDIKKIDSETVPVNSLHFTRGGIYFNGKFIVRDEEGKLVGPAEEHENDNTTTTTASEDTTNENNNTSERTYEPIPSQEESTSSQASPSNAVSEEEFETERRNAIIQKIIDQNIEVPEYLVCPLTQRIFFEPVVLADGHTYEKAAIEEWISNGNTTSPMTSEPLTHYDLVPAHTVQKAIITFCEKYNLA